MYPTLRLWVRGLGSVTRKDRRVALPAEAAGSTPIFQLGSSPQSSIKQPDAASEGKKDRKRKSLLDTRNQFYFHLFSLFSSFPPPFSQDNISSPLPPPLRVEPGLGSWASDTPAPSCLNMATFIRTTAGGK